MMINNRRLDSLIPYDHNPRINDQTVPLLVNSIKQFGFKVPLVIDSDNVIVAGHTRYKAALELGMEEVPCIIADDLSPEQVKAFRLADNKVAEASKWDFGLLQQELDQLSMEDLDFDMSDFGFPDDDNSIIINDEEEDISDVEPGKNKGRFCTCPACGLRFEPIMENDNE